MKKTRMKNAMLGLTALSVLGPCFAEIQWTEQLQEQVDRFLVRDLSFTTTENIQYGRGGEVDLYGDLFVPENPETKRPGILMIHGGGWRMGDRNWNNFRTWCEEYARMGFVVFNIDYRLAADAPAPAAVEDVICAVRFMHAKAEEWGLDADRITVTGGSAGGHLALMAGLCNDPEFSNKGGWEEWPEDVAAVVNRFGITDVADVTDGEHARSWAAQWLPKDLPNRDDLIARLSPLSYVARTNLPPVFTYHGAEDPIVPVEHAMELHLGLLKSGNNSALYVVPFANHGLMKFRHAGLKDVLTKEINRQVIAFLIEAGVLAPIGDSVPAEHQ